MTRMNDTLNESPSELGDFASLANHTEYSNYFRQLARVCGHLVDCYQDRECSNRWEGSIIRQLALRLLNTVRALEMKYLFSDQASRPLMVDVTESGFPNHIELSEMETDLRNKSAQLRDLPGLAALKQALAEELLRGNAEPIDILRQLSLRTYYDSLHEDSLFLPFNQGRLQVAPSPLVSGKIERGTHRIAFSCFDFASNCPYITFMTFNSENGSIDESSPEFAKLLNVLQQEGSRAPDIGILAMSIDDALEDIHPKFLKRLRIGPLYSRVILQNRTANPADFREPYLQELLRGSNRDDDFVLLLTEEVIFSKRQEVTKSLFSPIGRSREVFAITESDPECARRRASAVQHYYLMSHDLLQQVQPVKAMNLRDFAQAKKLAIDAMGEIHGL